MKHALKFGSLALLVACSLRLGAQVTTLPAGATLTPPQAGVPTFKVDVNLVLVEVSVHDGRGSPIKDLKKEDFRVYEDGVEEQTRTFSHDELPLALALVVDSSSSIASALDELRAGALDTLLLLKPQDEVAVFKFTEKPELMDALTTDRHAIAEDLWAISPWSGTNINDALYEAAVYLGREARDRRHALILVSDNESSERPTHGDHQVVRAALETGTLVYSIKVGYLEHSKGFLRAHPEAELHSVEKICRETGGQMIDTRQGGSVTSAMATIITWLRQGYTLGYTSANPRYDGAYRTIEVRLAERWNDSRHKYTLYARPGYYAPQVR
jgi:Ca-activated chloride channel family protein